MRRGPLALSVAAALALLAGCSGGDAELSRRLEKLEAENAQLRQTLNTLSEQVQPLGDKLRELDAQNRELEKMLALAETDLRSRLREIVQDEGGGRRGGFFRRVEEPPPLPKPYLGFSGLTNSPELAEKLKLAAKTGVVVTDVTKGAPAEVAGLKENEAWRHSGPRPNCYQREHDLLLEAIRKDKPHNETERCAYAVLASIMGRMAAFSGKVVTWDQALASKLELAPGLENITWESKPPVLPDKNGRYPVAQPGVAKAL